MSYDIYIHDPKTSVDRLYEMGYDLYDFDDPRSLGIYLNYTYNLSRFFNSIGCNPKRDLNGLSSDQIVIRINRGINMIDFLDMKRIKERFDPPIDVSTGRSWGTVEGAILLLERIRVYCAVHPGYILEETS